MQVNRIFLAALLATLPVMADEQPDADLLEFLGGETIEVEGEWVDPLALNIEDDSANTAQTTTR
ncbi:MAG: hypothetical protein HYZ31_13200 [Gammaproteobacteria bacterium]|jgi:hypothetical protein|nr:hypothetical protein [Gammaproteobacteria bacterium]